MGLRPLVNTDLTSGVRDAKEIWELITLIRKSGIPDVKQQVIGLYS